MPKPARQEPLDLPARIAELRAWLPEIEPLAWTGKAQDNRIPSEMRILSPEFVPGIRSRRPEVRILSPRPSDKKKCEEA